jgi:surfeit locus 1 family protein
MPMLRFLLKPRWIALGLFAIVMSVVCVRLGFWQLDRLKGRKLYNHLYEQGMAAAPVPVEQLLEGGAGPLLYRKASASGTYDDGREVILYGRSSRHGFPGNHLLTPLVLSDGRALLVDRGWVPFNDDTPPVAEAAPPAGTVTVTGLLAPTEPGGSPQQGATTTFTKVDLAQIGRQLPYHLLPYWLELQGQSPAQSGTLPELPPVPELTNGPHLSYAIQWFFFASIAAFGFTYLVIREMRLQRRPTQPAVDPLL